ncbi:MAG: polysaccharide export outer membrane protein [Parasphingorhabdus sp.]|jgi:polysaccharide export outer membrane protein|uniref:polysaccharide biosynthesis/export family protein n=1 Tax=Parasphingorhabdus sp. TaxID=2709688 RepID=UPI002B26E4D7|nr:polysaccharide biosynthesis/export family protein [Parasphingorhabdus sp.]|tara:strand:+ start:2420 stop:3130 length:711 start_codon:yes stop_codon:yes gene_type:complete
MKIQLKSLFILAVSGAMLSACATSGPLALASDVELTTLNELPANPAAVSYQIRPLESVEIGVFGSETLSGTYFVDEQGRINFPLIGVVETDGLTPSGVEDVIENRLRGQYILQPQVTVRPTKLPELTVSVGGEVKKPGTFLSSNSQTLLRAVYNAGGLSDYAKSEEVIISRTVGDQKYIGVYNLTAIERGNYADPAIYPNDIISVGDSPSKRFLQSVLAYVPLLSTSAILIDRVGR